MKYKVGDRVRIVDEWIKDSGYNKEGLMDHWLGQVMTVREIDDNYYRMVEDIGENSGCTGWYWDNSMVAELVDNIADNFDMENILNILEF